VALFCTTIVGPEEHSQSKKKKNKPGDRELKPEADVGRCAEGSGAPEARGSAKLRAGGPAPARSNATNDGTVADVAPDERMRADGIEPERRS